MAHIKFVLTSLLFLIIYTEAYAQSFNLDKNQSKLIVEGTSSLHDWYLKATDMGGQVNFNLDSVLHIKKLTLLVQVMGLKGGKKGMIKKMRNTLQVVKYSTIAFQLKRTDKTTRINNRGFRLETAGTLTIAGVNRDITLKLLMTVKNNSITIVGNKKLKMTDYDLKPPKALFGMFKTNDSIKVKFSVIYN